MGPGRRDSPKIDNLQRVYYSTNEHMWSEGIEKLIILNYTPLLQNGAGLPTIPAPWLFRQEKEAKKRKYGVT